MRTRPMGAGRGIDSGRPSPGLYRGGNRRLSFLTRMHHPSSPEEAIAPDAPKPDSPVTPPADSPTRRRRRLRSRPAVTRTLSVLAGVVVFVALVLPYGV